MKKNTKTNHLQQYRQGDVLLTKVERLPKDRMEIEPHLGRYILAEGEATGHHHSVPAIEGIDYFEDNITGLMYLNLSKPTTLTHQEHDPIDLVEGIYVLEIQREYHPTIGGVQVND